MFLKNLTGQDLLQKKRKAQTEQTPLPAKKQLLVKDNSYRSDQSASVNSELQDVRL